MAFGLFASLRNAVKWAGFDLNRQDGAIAQAVVMLDPVTGLGVQSPYGSGARIAGSATIANGASVSSVIDLDGTALLGFIMPAAWTVAALNVEVSTDNAIFQPLYDSAQALVSSISTPVVGAAYALDALPVLPWRYFRFRSGTAASPVNQGALRAITYVTRPLS